MIVFDLKCSRGHVFEVWFADSASYEKQVKRGQVSCTQCGDTTVEKALMTPNLAPSGKGKAKVHAKDNAKDGSEEGRRASAVAAPARSSPKAAEVYKALRAAREVIEKNCDNVGEGFAEEARKIHYGEAEKRNIYGDATPEDARELKEEGVEFDLLPWLPPRDS
jgi:hypothetical protein